MNFYITSGTYEFLEKIMNKYPQETMILMQNTQTSVLIHETQKKSVFGSPRKYEVISQSGELENKGMVNLFNIPISDEGKPVFEFNFAKQIQSIKDAPGFIAYRFLKPKKGDTYILLTLWTDESYFKHWKGSNGYQTIIDSFPTETPLSSNQLFNGGAYETEYTIPSKENNNAPQ